MAKRSFVIVMLLVLLIPVLGWGEDTEKPSIIELMLETGARSIRGLEGFAVFVDLKFGRSDSRPICLIGIDRSEIYKIVQRAFFVAGIEEVDFKPSIPPFWLPAPKREPTLFVTVYGSCPSLFDNDYIHYAILVRVQQNALIFEDKENLPREVTTWYSLAYGAESTTGGILEHVKREIEKFVFTWRIQNPK